MQNTLDNAANTPQTGLVVSYFGKTVEIEAQNGDVLTCHLRRNQPIPVVGDQVEFKQEGHEAGVILRTLPRRSILARGNAHGTLKPIAANVDNLVIVMAPSPIFSKELVDRYIVAAEVLGIEPIIVINKIDLLDQNAIEHARAILAVYQSISYKCLLTSTRIAAGEAELLPILANKVSVLVGPSGVGKSSITSKLVEQAIRVKQVSAKGIGRHTTTASRLYHLPHGGDLIDSPGVRDFQLWPVTRQEVLKGFREFQPFLTGCKFRDCQHIVEPGCMLLAALKDGKIDPIRFEHFKAMIQHARENN